MSGIYVYNVHTHTPIVLYCIRSHQLHFVYSYFKIVQPFCSVIALSFPVPRRLTSFSIAASSGRLTTAYKYDSSGRVVGVLAPTGKSTPLASWMGLAGDSDRQLLTVGVGGTGTLEDALDGNTLSLSPDGDAYFSHGA